jgi:hypothetical protein
LLNAFGLDSTYQNNEGIVNEEIDENFWGCQPLYNICVKGYWVGEALASLLGLTLFGQNCNNLRKRVKRVSGYQGIRVSGYQGIRVSGYQGIRMPGYQESN